MNTRPSVACVLALFLAVLSGCSQLYDFSGVIVDGDGAPITGATVTPYPHDWDRPSQLGGDGESAAEGKFESTWSTATKVEYFKLIVTAAGFCESEQLVVADQMDLRIVLKREPVSNSDNAD